jgi:exodeoxyribonuclease-5
MNNGTIEAMDYKNTQTETATIFDFLPFSPTREQSKALYEIAEFVDPDNTEDFYILAGAAGTGKTSMLKAVVDYLAELETGMYLCAPTAQAAKVLSVKTGKTANTIQKVIYRTRFNEDGQVSFLKKANELEGYSIFLVDEASMVSDELSQGMFSAPNGVLTDLIEFCKEGNRKNKIIFIGDRYQLPPVNEKIRALDPDYLEEKFRLSGSYTYMIEVKRQNDGSEILRLANAVRMKKDAGTALTGFGGFHFSGFSGILSRYLNLFNPAQPDNVVYIAGSNRNTNFFNNAVRKALGKQGPLAKGDFVLLDETLLWENQLIPKGERGFVLEVETGSFESKAALNFCIATIGLPDSEGRILQIRKKVMLDWITEDRDGLSGGMLRGLTAERNRENRVYRESQRIWDDEYLSALRLRFAYGVTCHKAQGSEWNHVLMHPWFNADDHAYLYTAITRARQTVASFYSSKSVR